MNAELRERLEKDEKGANKTRVAEKKAREAAAALEEKKKADRKAGVRAPRAPKRSSAVIAQEKKYKEERRENDIRQRRSGRGEHRTRLLKDCAKSW